MGQIKEYFKSAIKQIIGNGYRTVMTMTGIVIGIAAVIAVVTLGNGMSDFVQSQINGIAGNYGTINIMGSKTSEVLGPDDVALLEEKLTDIKGVSPYYYGDGKVKGTRGTYAAQVQGGSESFENVYGNKVVKGQYFTRQQVESGQRVCVMLLDDAKKLFGTEECIGKEVEITCYGMTAAYTIIGLRDHMNEMYDFLMAGQDYSASIEIPFTAMAGDFGYYTDRYDTIVLFADQSILAKRVEEAKNILLNKHGLRGNSSAIDAYSMTDLSDEVDTILGYASTFLLLVSVISLVVGGIGVMNIMLVSVTERTREIGIRKSIGARTGAILSQFLFEASILTFLGGIVGIILGIVLSRIMCAVIGFNMIISPTSVLGAAFFSVMVGLFFGLYPARKAAKMKPIDALRI